MKGWIQLSYFSQNNEKLKTITSFTANQDTVFVSQEEMRCVSSIIGYKVRTEPDWELCFR